MSIIYDAGSDNPMSILDECSLWNPRDRVSDTEVSVPKEDVLMPAPLLDVGQIIQTRVFCQLYSQVSVNVQHWRVDSIAGTPHIDDVPGVWENLIHTLYKAMMPVQAGFRGVGASILSPLPRSIEYYSNAEAGPGVASGSPMPSQVCGMISLRTNNAGPKNRGRQYIPFPSAVFASTDESPASTYIAQLVNLADLQLAMTVTDGFDEAELKRIIYPGPGVNLWDVEAATAKDMWATQRRRGDYGSLNSSPV